MRDALLALDLPVSPERLLEDATSNQDIRKNGETTPGDLRVSVPI